MNLPAGAYKKIGLIAAFIAAVGIAGYFLFVFFFRSEPIVETPPSGDVTVGNGLPSAGNGTTTTEPGTGNGQLPDGTPPLPTGPGQSPSTPSESLSQVANQAAFSTVSSSGQAQFYNQADNRFYAVDNTGKLTTLSGKQFFGVQNVTWSPTADRAIMEYPDGSNTSYDFKTQTQVTLPKHWEDFAFAPAGDRIVAKSIGLDPDNRWLVISNADGSQAKNVEPLGENADQVISSWSPNNQSIAFFVDGVDFNRKEVFFVGQNGENFKSTVTEGRGFQPLWSPKGDELIYSVYSAENDYKPSLWIVGAQGDSIGSNRRPLELNTWADKCSFYQSQLYCAVPTTLERGAGMFPSTAQTTPDLLYRINPATGQKELIPTGGTASMNSLSFSADGQYLYYLEGGTNILRKVKLR